MAEEAIGSDEEDDEADRTHTWPKKSRANSDVSQLDVGDRASPESMTSSTFGATSSTLGAIDERPARPRSSSLGSTVRQDGNSDTEGAGAGEASSSAPATKSPSPILSPSLPGVHDQPPASFPPSPLPRTRVRQRSAPGERRGTAMPRPKPARNAPKSGAEALKGTIARATVDTTLAVIPAEAFRRLTRKYPKASGTVVQVVLERFSRVTFMTGQSTVLSTGAHS
jgi:lysophospholipid hydrolase